MVWQVRRCQRGNWFIKALLVIWRVWCSTSWNLVQRADLHNGKNILSKIRSRIRIHLLMYSKRCQKIWCLENRLIFPSGFASRPAGKLPAMRTVSGFFAIPYPACLLPAHCPDTKKQPWLAQWLQQQVMWTQPKDRTCFDKLIDACPRRIHITYSDLQNSVQKSLSNNFSSRLYFSSQ